MRAALPYLIATISAAAVLGAARLVALQLDGGTVLSIYNAAPRWIVEFHSAVLGALALGVMAGPIWAVGRKLVTARIANLVVGLALFAALGAIWTSLNVFIANQLSPLVNVTGQSLAVISAGWLIAGLAWGAVFAATRSNTYDRMETSI